MKEILVHLNVEAGDDDTRDADKVADDIVATLTESGDARVQNLVIVCPLAEEI